MKKLFLLFFSITIFLSCYPDDPGNRFHYEILKIESFVMPTEIVKDNIYPITIRYKRPTTCHYFNNLYYSKSDNTRTIAVESIVEERDNCLALTDNNPEIEHTFNFSVKENTGYTYLFKFYKGKNDAGESIFEEVSITVTD